MTGPRSDGNGSVLLAVLAATLVSGAAWHYLGPTADSPDSSAAARAVRPAVTTRTVILPAGWRMEQAADQLQRNGIADGPRFVRLARDPELARRLTGYRIRSLEGFLMPGTYEFRPGTPARRVVVAMVDRFRRRFGPALESRARKLGLTVPQVVTLASVVQREVGFSSDMPATAGVLLNRLRRGMRLQSDPTVLYALDTAKGVGGDATLYWQRRLSPKRRYRRELRFRSPYNTYLHRGPPPGPIASPDLTAIRSVLDPARVRSLYFLAKPNGANAYAITLASHKRNIRRYRGRHRTAVRRPGLQGVVERLAGTVDGHVGVVVKNLRTGEAAALNARDFFSTADLYQLFAAEAAFERHRRGYLDFGARLRIPSAAARRDGQKVRANLGARPTVRHALTEMVTRNSNGAGSTLMRRLGRNRVNRLMRRRSLSGTWLTRARFVTTPRDIARLVEGIAAGRSVSKRASAAMLRLLPNKARGDALPRYLPARARVAHKASDLQHGAHDAGIVYTRNGPVVIVVMTEGVQHRDDAVQAVARLSQYVVDYLETYRRSARRAVAKYAGACPVNPVGPQSTGALQGKTIVLDPGHGGADTGALFKFANGQLLQEKKLVLDVSFRLRTLLSARGATVYMTRCRDTTVPLEARVGLANHWSPDLFLSLHLNGSPDPEEDGSEVYYLPPLGGPVARYLIGSFAAPGLWDTLNRRMSLPNLGAPRGRFTVLVYSRAPAALSESLFMTNPAEAAALRRTGDHSRRQQIARGHLKGVLNYFRSAP